MYFINSRINATCLLSTIYTVLLHITSIRAEDILLIKSSALSLDPLSQNKTPTSL